MLENPASVIPVSGRAKLTPRERDCLRLLARGLLSGEVRAELGISQSTLDAHLASARRKLDARTTLQAVLTCWAEEEGDHSADPASMLDSSIAELSEGEVKLADALARCRTFDQAWQALQNYLADFGVITVNLGVIADPAGAMDRSNVAFWSAASDELTNLYYTEQVAQTDPVAQYVASYTKPRLFDGESTLPILKSHGQLPLFMEYLFDNSQGNSLCIPARDPLTGAPFGMNLPLVARRHAELGRSASAIAPQLQQSLYLFWNALQNKRLIAGRANLTPREQEMLQFVARGFAVAEIAERINVSKRATE